MRRRKLSVFGLALALALASLAAPVGRASQESPERPVPRFTGTTIPEPPRQHAPWTAPSSELPQSVVSAAGMLFEQGMADPRGCEYREVEVVVGSVWGNSGLARAHAWALPARDSSGQRFAVCWNGLVYPVVSAGARANLRADVEALLETDKQTRAKYAAENASATSTRFRSADIEQTAVSHGALLPLQACMLVRLGEGELAARVWSAWSVGRMPGAADGDAEPDPYLEFASDWVWALFNRTLLAHMRGDDRLALLGTRAIVPIRDAVEAEAARRSIRRPPVDIAPEDEPPPYLPFLEPLPALLADQERRAREPRPTNGSAPEGGTARIARLVARLDEVAARQGGQPGGVDVGGDPIVAALLAEGENAVDALIDAVEHDERLTRSVSFHRNFFTHRHILSVSETAYRTLRTILHTSFDEVGNDIDDPREQRKARVAAIRAYWRKYGGKPLAERWYLTLADDAASREQWLDSAANIVQPEDVKVSPGGWVFIPERKPGQVVPMRGESLRPKANPSVTELIGRRAIALVPARGAPRGVFDQREACVMALILAKWDAKAAVATLGEVFASTKAWLERERSSADSGLVACLGAMTVARVRGGDERALADYGAWVRTLRPDRAEHAADEAFEPLWRFADNPEARSIADALFNGDSLWNPLFRPREEGGGFVAREVFDSPLLAVPAFRRHVVRLLDDSRVVATLVVRTERSAEIRFGPDYSTYTEASGTEPKLTPGAEQDIRLCDLYAWTLSAVNGFPRFQPFWSVEERDRAIEACGRVLDQFGDGFVGTERDARLVFEPRDLPATGDDVRQGRAIFSLEGEARVVELERYPTRAVWKARPSGEGYGMIWQAEEVFEMGRWRRFYGFVGQHEIARVPAEEVELLPY